MPSGGASTPSTTFATGPGQISLCRRSSGECRLKMHLFGLLRGKRLCRFVCSGYWPRMPRGRRRHATLIAPRRHMMRSLGKALRCV
jgi:hypothetical protein